MKKFWLLFDLSLRNNSIVSVRALRCRTPLRMRNICFSTWKKMNITKNKNNKQCHQNFNLTRWQLVAAIACRARLAFAIDKIGASWQRGVYVICKWAGKPAELIIMPHLINLFMQLRAGHTLQNRHVCTHVRVYMCVCGGLCVCMWHLLLSALENIEAASKYLPIETCRYT